MMDATTITTPPKKRRKYGSNAAIIDALNACVFVLDSLTPAARREVLRGLTARAEQGARR